MVADAPIAYEGKAPYVFVSYCHKDEEDVLPLISKFALDGMRLWFDDGIDPGAEWPEVIANHLEGSTAFIAFVSEQSMASHNCRREFNYAMMENKPSLIILLDEAEMTPVMKMQMSTIQALKRSDYSDERKLVSAVVHSQATMRCLEEPKTRLVSRSEKDDKDELYALVDNESGKRVVIGHDRFKIGRKAETCDFVIPDSSVSRMHAMLHIVGGRLYIIDDNSLNGTYVNGQEIPVAQPTLVEPFDVIEIGDVKFTVQLVKA